MTAPPIEYPLFATRDNTDAATAAATEARDALAAHAKDEVIVKFFAWTHLPPHLQAVSKPFADLALEAMKLPRSAERAAGLRKLLEAKDCIVRAALA